VSESSHPPTWPGQCTLESHPPTPSNASRPQAYIIDSGRKPAALSHINARGRKFRTPHINNPGRKLSGARTSALQAASLGGGGEGEEGSNPPVHREREGSGAIPTPNTPPIHAFL
jgi:hypothetical protein